MTFLAFHTIFLIFIFETSNQGVILKGLFLFFTKIKFLHFPKPNFHLFKYFVMI